MDPAQRFARKAEKYANYRWDYAPQAIDEIFALACLSEEASVVDIGAGTGMLGRHFLGRVKTVYAIEPNAEMRQYAEASFTGRAGFVSLDGIAEAIPLPDHSIDLLVVGRALHWFDPSRTRVEFCRVAKPGGWLAVLQVPCLNQELVAATRAIRTVENGWDVEADKSRLETIPPGYYFEEQGYIEKHFPEEITETWNDFFGRLCSLSPAPDENREAYPRFAAAAREVFQKFSQGGRLRVEIATQIQLGRLAGHDL